MKRIIVAAIAGPFVSTAAFAQDSYPNRVVKVIGGSSEGFAKTTETTTKRYSDIIKTAKITAETN